MDRHLFNGAWKEAVYVNLVLDIDSNKTEKYEDISLPKSAAKNNSLCQLVVLLLLSAQARGYIDICDWNSWQPLSPDQ